MKIIYHCYGGTHSSVLAAAYHLGIIVGNKPLSAQELFSCPFFDRIEPEQIGKIISIGQDRLGHDIFVLGCKNAGTLVEKIIREFCRLYDVDTGDFLLVSTIHCLNFYLRLGGFLSRQLKIVTAGRFFLLLGARRSMHKIKSTVEHVKQNISEKRK